MRKRPALVVKSDPYAFIQTAGSTLEGDQLGESTTTDEFTRNPAATMRRTTQVVLLIVGAIALFWLINIFALNGNIGADTTEALTQTVWAAILVAVLVLVFAGELVLFFFRPAQH